jgi:hypothetical protein
MAMVITGWFDAQNTAVWGFLPGSEENNPLKADYSSRPGKKEGVKIKDSQLSRWMGWKWASG